MGNQPLPDEIPGKDKLNIPSGLADPGIQVPALFFADGNCVGHGIGGLLIVGYFSYSQCVVRRGSPIFINEIKTVFHSPDQYPKVVIMAGVIQKIYPDAFYQGNMVGINRRSH